MNISSLFLQSFPCGIEWGSRRRWDAFSKTWNLPSRPLSSLYSSCRNASGIDDLICPEYGSADSGSADSGSVDFGSADYGIAYDENFVYDYKNKYAEAE